MTDFTGATSYPGSLDAFDTTKDNADPIGQDLVNARAAVVAIETELGANPSGSESTVAARLAVLDAGYTNAVLVDRPSAYWPLRTKAPITDYVGNRALTPTGGIVLGGAAGPLTTDLGATEFDGSDDYLRALAFAPLASKMTLEVFGYRDSPGSTWACLCNFTDGGDDQLFCEHSSHNVHLRVGGTTATWSAAWPGYGQWVHAAVTIDLDNNLAELFINGVSQGTQAQTGAWSTAGNLEIGQSGYSGKWDGRLAEVAVYHYILSGARIAAHYAAR